jgi:hypothetical protein
MQGIEATTGTGQMPPSCSAIQSEFMGRASGAFHARQKLQYTRETCVKFYITQLYLNGVLQ